MKLQIELAPLTIICGDYLLDVDVECDHNKLFLPECNSSSKQQVELARGIVESINNGNELLVITYSDYIIKELNTLIMLNYKKVPVFENYNNGEFLDVSKVKVYDIINGVVNDCNITELGIEVPSLDNIINDINQMQEVLIWCE